MIGEPISVGSSQGHGEANPRTLVSEFQFTTSSAARLAVETIDGVAAKIPDPTLAQTFLAWPRVQAVRDDLDRLRCA